MNFITISIFLTLGGTAIGAEYPTLQDLRDALGTPYPFWMNFRTFKRSDKGQEHKCIFSQKINLNNDDYVFTQGFKSGSGWHYKTLFAALVPGEGNGLEPILDVSEKQGKGKRD
uniref:Secreted protein n=1 Tax=Amblyomma cajennense TaxID=34607 RepID=A0A023FUY6_AMBCJ